jgi:hypothetical protein
MIKPPPPAPPPQRGDEPDEPLSGWTIFGIGLFCLYWIAFLIGALNEIHTTP